LLKTVEFLKLTKERITDTLHEIRIAIRDIQPYIERHTLYLVDQTHKGNNVLFEGAQSYGLDLGHGTPPFTTSSSTQAGAAFVGGDLPPRMLRNTNGVTKIIKSRVGHGPFISEFGGKRSEDHSMDNYGQKHTQNVEAALFDTEELLKSDDPFYVGIALRMIGGEYGVSTGRPRRIGMPDTVQMRHAALANGVDELFITKCDLLRDFARTRIGKIPLVVGYELDGKKIDYVPATAEEMYRVKAEIAYRPAFTDDISGVRHWEDLPKALQNFVYEIEDRSDTNVAGIGNGPGHYQIIIRD